MTKHRIEIHGTKETLTEIAKGLKHLVDNASDENPRLYCVVEYSDDGFLSMAMAAITAVIPVKK